MPKAPTKAKNSCPIEPFGNYIVVEPMQHIGSIVIPLGADTGPVEKGTVVAVGPGTFSVNGVRLGSDTKVGDFVMFRRGMRAVEIPHDDNTYIAVQESDLVAKLPKESW